MTHRRLLLTFVFVTMLSSCRTGVTQTSYGPQPFLEILLPWAELRERSADSQTPAPRAQKAATLEDARFAPILARLDEQTRITNEMREQVDALEAQASARDEEVRTKLNYCVSALGSPDGARGIVGDLARLRAEVRRVGGDGNRADRLVIDMSARLDAVDGQVAALQKSLSSLESRCGSLPPASPTSDGVATHKTQSPVPTTASGGQGTAVLVPLAGVTIMAIGLLIALIKLRWEFMDRRRELPKRLQDLAGLGSAQTAPPESPGGTRP